MSQITLKSISRAPFRETMMVLFMCMSAQLLSQRPFPEVPEVPEMSTSSQNWRNTIEPIPSPPSYLKPESWALNPVLSPSQEPALPKRRRRSLHAIQSDTIADVFFIHPTMLLDGSAWNADVSDENMNASVDLWPIRHQASAFSSAGRVFAPRYRQAHVRIFSLGDSLSWAAAEVAYADVRRAFEVYLEQWNDGRPIVLAGHSQGSFHGRRLIQEFFDGTALANLLVAAYLPGMDMYASEFDDVPLCLEPTQVGCLCTWMTYGRGYLPHWLLRKRQSPNFTAVLVTHPVTWSQTVTSSDYPDHLGVVRPSFRLSKSGAIRGDISPDGVLWIDHPKVFGGKWLQREDWHSGDINLFWVNVRKNVSTRAKEWQTKNEIRSSKD